MNNIKLFIWTSFVFVLMLTVAPNDRQIIVGTISGLVIGLLARKLIKIGKAG